MPAVSWTDLTDDQIRRAISDGFRPGFEIPQSYVDQFRDIDFSVFAVTSQAGRAYLDERPRTDRHVLAFAANHAARCG